MGGDVNVCNHLQALAASRASRATRVPPAKRVSQVGGHSYHQRNSVLGSCLGGVIRMQVMSGDVNLCHHLQALAASRAITGATGQTGVTGQLTLLPLHEPSGVPRRCHGCK